jgi:hypothetical protein
MDKGDTLNLPKIFWDIIEDSIEKSYKECNGLLAQYCDFIENVYDLPPYIDKRKLTEEEFEVLRKLIEKGLVAD